MKSYLIIGMGRFGSHLAKKLYDLGHEVVIIDRTESKIAPHKALYDDAHIGDCTNPNVLKELGINNFDVCFVTIGDNFQSSLQITSLLDEMGAKKVVSKANSDIQAKFLKRNGATEVVYPIKEVSENLAIRMSANNLFDYIELSSDYSISECLVPEIWLGKTIADADVRKKHNANILAIKQNNSVITMPTASYTFEYGDHVIIMAKNSDLFRFVNSVDK